MIKRFRLKNQMISEFCLYAIIGLISATLDSIVFILLRKMGIVLFISNVISINIGILNSFFLNTYFNFKPKNYLKKRAISFFTIGYIGLGISSVFLFIFVNIMKYPENLVKIASIILVAIIQFILNKMITYRKGMIR